MARRYTGLPQSALPTIGVRASVENVAGYQKALQTVQSSTQRTNRSLTNYARSTQSVSKDSRAAQRSVDNLSRSFAMMGGPAYVATGTTQSFLDVLTVISPTAASAVAGVTALVTSLVALNLRSSEIEGVRAAFYNLNATFGTVGDTLLGELRDASMGSVADMELMRLTNLALAGATDDVGYMFGRSLPKLMEIARVQAQATGRNITYLFDSLVTGLKRTSPLLIDNTGLVINQTEAHQMYAAEIGKTISELTEEERQLALLNATLKAGNEAIEAAGVTYETNAIKMQRINAGMQNTFDKLARALDPIFTMLVNLVDTLFKTFGPIVDFLIEVLGTVLNLIGKFGNMILAGLTQIFGPFVKWISDVLTIVGLTASYFAMAAGRITAAFAEGLYWGLNQYIMPAVFFIAKSIADFLVGQSPPPLGPLSVIDQGGMNVMLAWIEGFTGVSLDPVAKVANEVATMMGSIATMSLDQVTAALERLDAFIKPFENRLALLEARFNALNDVANSAISAIERQQTKLLDALVSGDEEAANMIRTLDAQRAQWEGIVDAQNESVDSARYQLGLAKATIAFEKTALMIRKDQLGTLEKEDETVEKVKEKLEKIAKGKKPGEEYSPEELAPASIYGVTPLEGFEPPSEFPLVEDFLRGMDTPGLLRQQVETAGWGIRIAGQMGRLSGNGISNRFKAMLTPIQGLVQSLLSDPFAVAVDNITFGLVGEGENQENKISITKALRNLTTMVPNTLSSMDNILAVSLTDPFTLAISNILAEIGSAGNGDVGAGVKTNLMTGLANIVIGIPTVLAGLGEALDLYFVEPFRIVFRTLAGLFGISTEAATVPEDAEMVPMPQILNGFVDGIPELTADLPTSLELHVTDPFLTMVDSVFTAVANPNNPTSMNSILSWFMGNTPGVVGTMAYILANGARIIGQFPATVQNAFATFGNIIWTSVALPLINVFNWIVDRLNDFAGSFNATFLPMFALVQQLTGISLTGLTIPAINRILTGNPPSGVSMPTPDTLLNNGRPQAAGGLTQGPGAVRVNERGQEGFILGPATQMMTFPNEFITTLTDIRDILVTAVSSPVPANAGGTTNSTVNTTQTFNFNNVGSTDEGRRMMTALRLFR